MTNDQFDLDQIIIELRRSPRKPWIWPFLNLVLDDILKKGLKNAPILKYNPANFIDPLWHCYYILKSHYWSNIYESFVNDDYSNPEFRMLWSITRFIDIHVPLYIRIVSLLLRIIYDRLEFSEYRQLPSIPPNLYHEPFFHMYGINNTTILKYIDKLTNNASLEIKEFFIDAIGVNLKTKPIFACLSQNILLPIPTYFNQQYYEFKDNLRIEFSKTLFTEDKIDHVPISEKDKSGKIHEKKMIFYTPGASDYINKPDFSKLLVHLVEFLKKIYLSLSKDINDRTLEKICDLFYFLLGNFKQDPSERVKIIHGILEGKIILNDISEELLNNFTYFPMNQEISLAEPLNIKNLFRFSLDLFNKPIIKDCYGIANFSTLWLFDSLVSRLTWLLRKKRIGKKRGIETENYYFKKIEEFIKSDYPKSKFFGPCKLIITNESKKNTLHKNYAYRGLKDSLKFFKYNFFEIVVPSKYLNKLDFIDFDLVLVVKDTLFLIEVKDDLFWDIRDLPYIIIRWGFNLKKKLERESTIVREPLLLEKLNKRGIFFKDVKTLIISQKNIIHPVFNTLIDLFKEIHKLHGKNIIYIGAG